MNQKTIPFEIAPWLHRVRDSLIVLDRTGKILWSSALAELVFGNGQDSLVGRSWRDLMVEPEFEEQFLKDLSTNPEEEFVCVLDLRNGEGVSISVELSVFPMNSCYMVLVHPEMDESENTEQVIMRALKMTSRMASVEEMVREMSAELLDKTFQLSEEKNTREAVLASMGEGLLVVNSRGIISQVNHAACRILEMDRAELMNHSLDDLGERVKLAPLIPLIRQAIGAVPTDTPQMQRLEIQEKVIEVTLAPIVVQNHPLSEGGIVANFRDVTKQVETDRLKNELISIVSHELRSPLANIMGYLDLVLSEPPPGLGEESLGFIQIAKKNADKLTKFVDDMLDLSRLDSGKVEMNLGDVDMEFVINFAIISFRTEADAKRIEVRKQIEGSPHALGDTDRIQQVVTNLLSNAIKYTPDGGMVEVSCRTEGEKVILSVKDTGLGIRPEDQARLFQRFFRVRSNETRKIRGTGLGLCIAKSIIEAHQGRLLLESEFGKGSCFTVELPIYRN